MSITGKVAPLIQISRDGVTTEYETMCRAVVALFRQFPSIKQDVARAKSDTQPLISKIRKVRNNNILTHVRLYAQLYTQLYAWLMYDYMRDCMRAYIY